MKIFAVLEEVQISNSIWGQIIFPNAHGKMFASCYTEGCKTKGLNQQQF